MLPKERILDIGVTSTSEEQILEYIFEEIEKKTDKIMIFTPNPEMLVYANKHQNFKKLLNSAEVSLPDGIGLMMAGRLLGKPLKQRITGTDMMEKLCKESVEKGVSIGLLGGGPGVAEKTAECLRFKYPGVKIVYVSEEWEDSFTGLQPGRRTTRNITQKNAEEKSGSFRVIPSKIQRFSVPNDTVSTYIDILFVAFGYPKQEEWIAANIERLPVKVAMGVGGAFDYISGNIPRAPKFIRNLGFEWLYRLVHQPWRWKRQLALIEFLGLVIKERLGL